MKRIDVDWQEAQKAHNGGDNLSDLMRKFGISRTALAGGPIEDRTKKLNGEQIVGFL